MKTHPRFSFGVSKPFRALRALSIAAIAALMGAGAAATHPSAATAALSTMVATITCAATTGCINGKNTSTGPGLTGTSANGTAVTAAGISGLAATGTSGAGVSGTSNSGAGVTGDSNSLYGVQGVSSSNNGVYGVSNTLSGVRGASTSFVGVLGSTTSGTAGIAGTSIYSEGVQGLATSTTSAAAIGVYGSAPTGYGLYGYSPNGDGYGVEGMGAARGVSAYSSDGVGVGSSSDSGNAFLGTSTGSNPTLIGENEGSGSAGELVASTSGPTLSVTNNGEGTGLEVFATAFGDAIYVTTNSYPFVAYNPDTASFPFYVDGSGNVNYTGSLVHRAAVAGGATVQAYSAESTAPTVEDTGSAQLVSGSAIVRLDPTFAATIDPRVAYRVFVTPNGDTRGLYVATKAPNGFLVRESQGGRSTVSFDYRIVAVALGQTGKRMAVIDPAFLPHVPPAVTHRSIPATKPLPKVQLVTH